MSNEQIFGNIIMLFSRFEVMMQSTERQADQIGQELMQERKKNEELQTKNNELQNAFNELKIDNDNLRKDIDILTSDAKKSMSK